MDTGPRPSASASAEDALAQVPIGYTKGINLNHFLALRIVVKSDEGRVNLSLVLSLAVVNDWFCIELPVESTNLG